MIPFTAVRFVSGQWRFTWAEDTGPVRVVLLGVELATTEDNEYLYNGSIYGSADVAPPLEVVPDNGTLAISEDNICFLTLQWHPVECYRYIIEGKDGSTWHQIMAFEERGDIQIYTYLTPLLVDQIITEWKVTAVDENKREGEPLEFIWKVVRPPNPVTGVELSCAAAVLTVQ